MKKYILGFLVISGVIIFAAVPVPQLTRRSSAGGSTNVLETALTTNDLSSLSANSLLGLNGSKQLFNPNIGSGLLFSGGALSASGVQLSAFNSAQFDTNGGNISLLSGAAGPTYTNLTVVSNAYFTTTYHTLINAVTALITNLNYVTGKGNVLNITNSIKLGDYYVYPILAGNGISLSTNASPTSGTNVTATVTNVTEAQLLLAANTTGNASTTKHGFVPVLPNDATKYYDGSGAYSIPAGTFTFSVNGTNITTPNVQDSATITWARNGSNFIASAAGSSGLAASASQYTIVGGAASGAANWTALSNAYVTAKSATPQGAALSAINRYTIFLLPGVYDLGSSSLTLDTQFIDISGISTDTGDRIYNGSLGGVYNYGDTVLKSSGHVIVVSANDVSLNNLALITSTSSKNALNTASAFTPQFKANNLLLYNTTGLGNGAMPRSINYDGTWTDCRCWNDDSFGGYDCHTIAGTYTRCKSGANSFGAGSFAGGAITISATCIDCEASASSFGGGGNRGVTMSGIFVRCRFNNPMGSGGSFFGNSGNSCVFSGTFIDTQSEDSDSFYGTVTGTMIGSVSSVDTNPLTVDGGTVLNCSLPAATITLTSGAVRNCVFANKTYNEAGTGTGTVVMGGTLKVNTTTTGNVGGGEDNLITYSVPANSLTVNGMYLEFDCAGTFNNSTHNKQLKVYFGATAIFDTGSLSGATLGASSWRAHGKIIRTGAATQKATTEFTLSGALLGALTTTTTTYTTAAETLSSASTFKCTGTDLDATPSNNEVVQEIEVLKWYPNN